MADITEDIYAALSDAELEFDAATRYAETSSAQAVLQSKYRKWHGYYAPVNGDQWPEDRTQRPGMIHITHNIIQPAVDVESRIESRLPRVKLLAETTDDTDQRQKAERAEKLMIRFLELSGWDVWLNEACKPKSLYGKVVLKPYWNKKDKRPDVSVIETPHNLRIGWGSSDYSTIDWTLYEYSISPFEAMKRYPDIKVVPPQRAGGALSVVRHSDHADPLDQMSPISGGVMNRLNFTQPSDYEGKQVRVWDYWCKQLDAQGEEHIVNAILVEGKLAQKTTTHDYYPDIPYIVIEHDHEPGSPEGLGDVEGLIDIQIELNRALSHWAQLISDEVDPAWQVDADSIPGGIVPRNGEILAAGEGKHITALEKSVNVFPIQQLVDEFKKDFFFRSGLSDILFTQAPGAQTAGRALQIQIEAVANRIDPRRDRLYAGLRQLLIFWMYMSEHVNPQLEVGQDADGQAVTMGLKEAFNGLRRWKLEPPEITPRDNLESITAVVNKLNNKLISLEDAMDELGVDSPLEMIRKIEAERSNPKLFPGDVQAYAAVLQLLQQIQAQQAAQPPVPGADPGAASDQADATRQAAAQQGQPQGTQGDNGSDVPLPATAAGGPPPPGAPAINNQTLVRAQPNGSAQTLQQIKL